MTQSFDAIVVGGGHNGLSAAHYLARGGLSVLVLERRAVVGGMAGPFAFFPGYRGAITNSPGSVEPKILRDMELSQHGLEWTRPDPTLVMPFPDGRAFVAWRDPNKTRESFRLFAERDQEAYSTLIKDYEAFARRLDVSLFEPAPSLEEIKARLTNNRDRADARSFLDGSIRDLLDARLESEEIKAVAGMLALAIANAGPSTPGTAFGLLLRPLSLNSQSVEAEHDPRRQPMRGSTGLPLGGMGSIAEAMERSLRADGVVVRKEAAVIEILTAADGTVRGVVLADGEEIAARTVLANVNPKTALLGMVGKDRLDPDLAHDLEALPMSGHAFKLVLALDTLPRFAAAPAGLETTYASCQFRIAPSLDYLDRCWADGQAGRPSEGPMFWGLIPTVADPTMAPPGKHMMSVNIWYAPYHLAQGDWDHERERFGEHCIDLITQYFPNLRDIIIDRRFFSPKDLEQEFGLLEAHHLHGDMLPARMFGARPVPGIARYRTPIKGLYLCGAGTWPGGFVTGVPGHNAAQQALADLRAGSGESHQNQPPYGPTLQA